MGNCLSFVWSWLFPTGGIFPAVSAWERLLRVTVQNNQSARGLAVIIYNTYETAAGLDTLHGTIKDGEAMKDTFEHEHLNFATIPIKDATKSDIREVIRAIATYPDYPEGYDCFSIVFSGHGGDGSTIMANDGEGFNFEEVIVQRLNKKRSDVSDHVSNISTSILVFIDACRGSLSPEGSLYRRKRGDDASLPTNMLVAYSTREGYPAYEVNAGGVWMQELAKRLRTVKKSVPIILAELARYMVEEKELQEPITVNTSVSIVLTKRPAIVPDGDDFVDHPNTAGSGGSGKTKADSGTKEAYAGRLPDDQFEKIKKIVYRYPHKWRSIGQGLGFTYAELDAIQGKPALFNEAPDSYLKKMLTDWYEWCPSDDRRSKGVATKEDIAAAVSQAGLGVQAETIRNC